MTENQVTLGRRFDYAAVPTDQAAVSSTPSGRNSGLRGNRLQLRLNMPDKVICSHMRRRVGQIRKAAKALANLKGKGADHYRRQTAAGLVGQLTKGGPNLNSGRTSAPLQGECSGRLVQNDGDGA
ncbi:hypothetical protein X744_06755 [Mesorhizobium sp. LNJC372A00]|nr:hypothetical protein X745_00030 [Mesorhizobium sp. LNJC374B00]ESY60655.1 hypothetical protein X744_06755 [Mesorhizobium sp. LNJC372A00]